MLDIITHPDNITPDWLTEALQSSGHLPAGSVVSADYAIIGTGKMGDNARFKLTYEGATEGAPKSVIIKFPAEDETARALAGAQGAYYNEVMFYRHLANRTAMRTPTIYANEISEDRQSFITVMEDMAPAEPGSQLIGATLEQSRVALREAAKLAAAFYGDDTLGDYDHVMSQARTDGGALAQDFLTQAWPTFQERFGHGINDECLAFAERYIGRHLHFATRFQGAKTLAHGDFRSENILFNGNEACTVDWQTTMETSALADAAYFLGGSVDTDDRRQWEESLVREYSEQLAALGVNLGFDECWAQYREQSMHGLMITILGASFSSPDERGDTMFLAMIQRHLQHCVDLKADEFLS
ncbi:phosphotransferase [Litorivivens sp.]|uniref:phosphotransferase n=1 Tax=Litorivivens sp. TaxID=2020868 RepID=UPI003564B353